MELESVIHQPSGLGTVENLSFSRLLGTFYSLERFREIDFSPASVFYNPTDSFDFLRKTSKDFLIIPPFSKADFEADTSLKKLNAMAAKLNDSDHSFSGGVEEFKTGLNFCKKNENGSRGAVGPSCESFGTLKASDSKRKVWELNELSKELELQESEREKKKIRKSSESEFEIVWSNNDQEFLEGSD